MNKGIKTYIQSRNPEEANQELPVDVFVVWFESGSPTERSCENLMSCPEGDDRSGEGSEGWEVKDCSTQLTTGR